VVVMPIYLSSANLYACGNIWLRSTISYVHDSPVAEYSICILATLWAFLLPPCLLAPLERYALQQYPRSALPTQGQDSPPWSLYGLWLLAVLGLSAPIMLYGLSTALPAENTMGFSANLLTVAHVFSGLFSFITMVWLAPMSAQAIVAYTMPSHAVGDTASTISCSMLQFARLMIMLVVPLIMILLFNQDCLGMWIHFYSPCSHDPTSFDIATQLCINESAAWSQPAAWSQQGSWLLSEDYSFPYNVTTHDSICSPPLRVPVGTCSRALIEALADVMFDKLVITAFLGPGLTLCIALPIFTQVWQRGWSWMYPERPFLWYSDDVELSYVAMLMEYGLSMGLLCPPILLLVSVGLAANCSVYHCATHVLKLGSYTRRVDRAPKFSFLYVSHAIGCVLALLFVLDNDLEGWLFASIGIPLGLLCGRGLACRIQTPPGGDGTKGVSTLLEPLLDRRNSDDCTSTNRVDMTRAHP